MNKYLLLVITYILFFMYLRVLLWTSKTLTFGLTKVHEKICKAYTFYNIRSRKFLLKKVWYTLYIYQFCVRDLHFVKNDILLSYFKVICFQVAVRKSLLTLMYTVFYFTKTCKIYYILYDTFIIRYDIFLFIKH